MTTDERISQDLAIVGRASRERPIAVEETLREVAALAEAARVTPASSVVSAGSVAIATSLLRFSRVYAQRFARACAGAMSLVSIIALLVYFSIPRDMQAMWAGPPTLELELLCASKLVFAIILLLPILVAHRVATHVAARRFERGVARSDDPLATARGLVRRVDGYALAGAIAGTMAFVLFFALMQVFLGVESLVALLEHHDDVRGGLDSWALVYAGVAIDLACMAALLIAHMRRGNIKVLLVSGLALGFASVIVGLRYDVGPMHVTWLAHLHPSLLLRAALTITGTAGLFFVVTGIALRRRAREEAELG